MALFGIFIDKFFDHMPSKFINKSAQKVSIFSSKANYARSLMMRITFLKKFSALSWRFLRLWICQAYHINPSK
jgi:hypothetical protein